MGWRANCVQPFNSASSQLRLEISYPTFRRQLEVTSISLIRFIFYVLGKHRKQNDTKHCVVPSISRMLNKFALYLLDFCKTVSLSGIRSGKQLKTQCLLVGAEGFEPPTLCSQSRCATRLRYAPTCLIVSQRVGESEAKG